MPLHHTLASHLPDALADLPWLVQVPVALALVAGLVLWLAGRRLLRPVTIMVGLGVGGLIGFLVLPVVLPGLGLSPYLGLIAGAASGLTTALLLYQVATAVTFGSALGAGCGIAAAAVLGTALTLPASVQVDDPDNPGQLGGGELPVYVPPPPKPVYSPELLLPEPDNGPEGADVENPGVIRAKPPARPRAEVPKGVKSPWATAGAKGGVKTARDRASAREGEAGPRPGGGQRPDVAASEARQVASSAAARVGSFWGAARGAWSEWWESVPGKDRPWIVGSTLAGVGIGTVLGLLLPAWSAGVVTALAGSAIWLPAAVWLGTAWGVPGFTGRGGGVSGLSTGGWIAVWLVAASIGVACQWYGLMPGGGRKGKKGRGKRKARPKADDDE
ncbi:MAG: hypothetical protein K2Q09_00775 [Phycisphaerales bacterium]|nr:hypothetical protein [Phycisphaerales bacterium]